GHAARGGDLGRHLGTGQHAAVAGFGALAQLDLDHLDLRVTRVGGELLVAERPVLVAAAEIARADLPDQVATMQAVPGGDGAFARVVRKAAALRARVERLDGVGRE